jgi:signal transduction histidine kinase
MVNSLKQAVLTTANSESKMREFLGDASHELRTPLTVIRGYIDILNSGQELTIEQRERAMNRLSSESLRMSETINDLLLLAEIGEIPIDNESSVDLSNILVNQIQDLSEQQKERVVKSTIASEVHVRGDFEQISRMIANVISNIARHTPKEAQVEVLLSRIDGNAVLVFDDAGPGLSDEMYARSHEGFQRFDRAHSKNGGGFGLGLSILSSIVQRHNGELSLSRSNLGGLRTQITLPLASLKV